MGKAEESQDSADRKEVGCKRSYPQGTGPSACLRCFCSLPAPETSEPAWQMAAFTEVRELQTLEVKRESGYSTKGWLPAGGGPGPARHACGGDAREDRALMERVESRQNKTQ